MGQTEIETLRQIPLEDFLARLGHEPIRKRGNEWWYAAPYRTERILKIIVDFFIGFAFSLHNHADISHYSIGIAIFFSKGIFFL